MENECVIRLYSRYSDRGSVSSTLKREILVDASAIIPGRALPDWPFSAEPPVVDYYDGEYMELSFEGKHLKVRVGGEMLELFSAEVPENIHVRESVVGYLSIEAVRPCVSRDFPEVFRRGSFNALVQTFLSDKAFAEDPTAVKRFMWTFLAGENLFFLHDSTLAKLRQSADTGNRYALYGLGRYHYYVRPDETSDSIAERCFRKAYEKGYPEGAAGLALMYRCGDIGLVDRLRAKTLLAEAMEQGCDLAAFAYIRDLIFGRSGLKSDPAKAIELLNELIRDQGDNPMWRYMRGWAVQVTGSFPDAKDDYEAAAHGGIIAAWSDLACALSFNEKDELADPEAFSAALAVGAEHRDCYCVYLQALCQVEDFDNMQRYSQLCARDRCISLLEKAYGMGSKEAAVSLGNTYYYGLYNTVEDYGEAYKWYARASILGSGDAYGQLYLMSLNGDIEEEGDAQYFRDICALKGARYGSEAMLSEAVEAYKQGRLTAFAPEIEQYYLPLSDGQGTQEEPDETDIPYEEEYPDDDGRYDAYV